MHKYQPRVHIIKKKDHTASLLNLKSEEFRTFIFPETVFTAITAYQNQLVSVHFTIFFFFCQKRWGFSRCFYLLGEKGHPSQYSKQKFTLKKAMENQPRDLQVCWVTAAQCFKGLCFLEPLPSQSHCLLPTLLPKPIPNWLLTSFLYLLLVGPHRVHNHILTTS